MCWVVTSSGVVDVFKVPRHQSFSTSSARCTLLVPKTTAATTVCSKLLGWVVFLLCCQRAMEFASRRGKSGRHSLSAPVGSRAVCSSAERRLWRQTEASRPCRTGRDWLPCEASCFGAQRGSAREAFQHCKVQPRASRESRRPSLPMRRSQLGQAGGMGSVRF